MFLLDAGTGGDMLSLVWVVAFFILFRLIGVVFFVLFVICVDFYFFFSLNKVSEFYF